MQYLALKERLKETLKEEAVAEISLPGEELDDSQQFEYIQAKVREKLRVVVTFSFLSSRCTSLRQDFSEITVVFACVFCNIEVNAMRHEIDEDKAEAAIVR
jgi:hypothetical protein